MEEAERAGGSLPTGERRSADSGPKSAGARDVRRACSAGRTEGEGEADGWATTTVSGGAHRAAEEGARVARGRAWAGPGRKRVGRAQLNSNI
jgi:hypothetical protein